jgi:hypothetical protein
LKGLEGVTGVARANGAYEIMLEEGCEPADAIREIVSAMPAARVELNRPTLEDVFVKIVTGESGTDREDVAKIRASVRADSGIEVG